MINEKTWKNSGTIVNFAGVFNLLLTFISSGCSLYIRQ